MLLVCYTIYTLLKDNYQQCSEGQQHVGEKSLALKVMWWGFNSVQLQLTMRS